MLTRVRAQDVDAQDAVDHVSCLDHGSRGGAAASVWMEQVGKDFKNSRSKCKVFILLVVMLIFNFNGFYSPFYETNVGKRQNRQ